jgi:hypothetical protein
VEKKEDGILLKDFKENFISYIGGRLVAAKF